MSPKPERSFRLGRRASVRETVKEATEELQAAGVPSAQHDAEELVAHCLGMRRADLAAMGHQELPPIGARLRALVERRGRREPLQYIVGATGFRSLELQTRPGVFIPRPETEWLAEHAIEALRASGAAEPLALEAGTGTGALAISIACEVERVRVVATDISTEALSLAAENARRAGVAGRIKFVRADWLDALRPGTACFQAIVSNPPYIPLAEVEHLMPEVRLWEPGHALAGGEDGMRFHEALSERAKDLLRESGVLLVETADGQAGAVAALLDAAGYANVRVRKDLAGIDRVVSGSRPKRA